MNNWRSIGGIWRSVSAQQWAPTLTSHDPNPPINLENPSGGTSYTLTAATGAFSLTGGNLSTPAARQASLASVSFDVSGQQVAFGFKIVLGSGSFAVSGQDVGVSKAASVSLGTGSFTESGGDLGTQISLNLLAGTGQFILTGQDATITATGQPVPPVPPTPGLGGGASFSGKRKRRSSKVREFELLPDRSPEKDSEPETKPVEKAPELQPVAQVAAQVLAQPIPEAVLDLPTFSVEDDEMAIALTVLEIC